MHYTATQRQITAQLYSESRQAAKNNVSSNSPTVPAHGTTSFHTATRLHDDTTEMTENDPMTAITASYFFLY